MPAERSPFADSGSGGSRPVARAVVRGVAVPSQRDSAPRPGDPDAAWRAADRRGPGQPPPYRRRRARASGATIALRTMAIVGALMALGAGAMFVPGSPFASARPAGTARAASGATTDPKPTPSPTPPPLPPLQFRATTVSVTTNGFLSWALMDRRTGTIWGSDNMTATTWPASMIKGWISADYLRRQAAAGTTPSASRQTEITNMIRNSDNNAAEDIFELDGNSAVISRLISICKLTDSAVDRRGWSFTAISARDTVRMADCIANGTAAGPQWTNWLLTRMRTVNIGDFGIRAALPKAATAQVAIKNGWLAYDDDHLWHVNCMAVTDTWAMAVLQRYKPSGSYNFTYGQNTCKSVATQLINPEYLPSAASASATAQ